MSPARAALTATLIVVGSLVALTLFIAGCILWQGFPLLIFPIAAAVWMLFILWCALYRKLRGASWL